MVCTSVHLYGSLWEIVLMKKDAERKRITMRQAVTYSSEYNDTLVRLLEENTGLTTLKYFLDVAYYWLDEQYRKAVHPDVVILGHGIPEELVIAAGANPYWLLGGSFGSVSWSDDLVPRDTDPVSRSILGYIHQPDGPDFSDSLFIVPLSCDSMRKVAYQLKDEGRKLFLVDIPPERNERCAVKKWQTQMLQMTAEIAAHTGTRIKRENVVSARMMVAGARMALSNFLMLARNREDIITASARQLVANSYYYSNDLYEWTRRLDLLNEELRERCIRIMPRNSRPGVLLMGSPVLFPNYKIPFLIDEIGLDIRDVADVAAVKTYCFETKSMLRGSRDRIIRNIAGEHYAHEASSAFVSNDVLYNYVFNLLKAGDIEGVVYHVLKGQIEYDFELERFEALFSANGIPVFRLETDYQYQDVEQLRIRMEAFCEMLTQNRYREVRMAL